MKFGRPDYDASIVDTSGKIPEDEPVLLLRGTDKLTVETARHYAHRARQDGLIQLSDSAYDQARAIELHQQQRMISAKTPDLPDEPEFAEVEETVTNAALDLIRREHAEALAGFSAAQVRAVHRILLARSRTVGVSSMPAVLEEVMKDEIRDGIAPTAAVIPTWMLAR